MITTLAVLSLLVGNLPFAVAAPAAHHETNSTKTHGNMTLPNITSLVPTATLIFSSSVPASSSSPTSNAAGPTNTTTANVTRTMTDAATSTTLTAYFNAFIDPAYVLNATNRQSTNASVNTIVSVAAKYGKMGPWSVTSKNVTPPSGDKHDYLSWAPYFWPNCSSAGNHTALTSEQVWTTCPYYERDGVTNPDVTSVTDNQYFEDMATAVFFNTLAGVFTGNATYTAQAVNFINTFFLNNATAINPNVEYGQVQRGPGKENGTHNGVGDTKEMTKVVSSILLLRKTNATQWTSQMDSAMVAWATSYSTWLATNPLGTQEGADPNNQGSYYVNQLAAMQILANNVTGAKTTINNYFNGIYKGQIAANGSQPLEAVRTRPYHYQCYNLEAMITNARIGQYLGLNFWNTKTTAGSTIQTATNYIMSLNPGSESVTDLVPEVGETASAYGDKNGTYAKFLASKLSNYYAQPFFFWSQPLAAATAAGATAA